jgi:hypothetical protein
VPHTSAAFVIDSQKAHAFEFARAHDGSHTLHLDYELE